MTGPEAHHLVHVMRARVGEEVVLFDGSGAEFTAEIEHVNRSAVEFRVFARREVDRELPVELTLGVALPKGERQKWLVEKAVELGVARLVPLETSRSVVQPGDRAPPKLGRAVIEASKQCGRNRLMEITAGQKLDEFVATGRGAACRLLAHPAARADVPAERLPADVLPRLDQTGPVLLAVGPEGGFTPEEIDLATAAGWQSIDLGPRVLRIETAAIVLSALVAAHLMATPGGGKS